jgi:hypothetical protein
LILTNLLISFIMLKVYKNVNAESDDDDESVGVRVGGRIGRGTRRKEEDFLIMPNHTNLLTKNRYKTKITKSLKLDPRCDEDELENLKHELSELKKTFKTFGVIANFKAQVGIITSKTRFKFFKLLNVCLLILFRF